MALTAAKQKELDDLEIRFAAETEGGPLSDAEEEELTKLEALSKASEGGLLDTAIDVGIGGLKLLDIPSTLLRGAAAGIAEAVTGEDVFNKDEFLRGLNPLDPNFFPGLGDLAERAGIAEGGALSDIFPDALVEGPEGGSPFKLNRGGLFDLTTRGTVGGIIEAVVDPINLLTLGGTSAAKKALKISNQIPQFTQEFIGGFARSQGKDLTGKAALELARKNPESFLKFAASEAGVLEGTEQALKEIKKFQRQATKTQQVISGVAEIVTAVPKKIVSTTKSAAKILKDLAINPLSAPSKKIGSGLLEAGTEEIADAALRANKKGIADTFFRHGIFGGPREIMKKADEAGKRLLAEREGILKLADDKLANSLLIDGADDFLTSDSLVHSFKQQLDELAKTSPGFSPNDANALSKELLRGVLEKGSTKLSLSDATKIKTNIDNIITDSERFGAFSGKILSKAKKMLRTSVAGAIETKVDRVLGEGIGTQLLRQKNNDLGNLITDDIVQAIKRASTAATRERRRGFRPRVGDIVLGAGSGAMASSPEVGAGIFAASVASRALNTPKFQTTVGAKLRGFGEAKKAPLLDIATREAAIEAARAQQPLLLEVPEMLIDLNERRN